MVSPIIERCLKTDLVQQVRGKISHSISILSYLLELCSWQICSLDEHRTLLTPVCP